MARLEHLRGDGARGEQAVQRHGGGGRERESREIDWGRGRVWMIRLERIGVMLGGDERGGGAAWGERELAGH